MVDIRALQVDDADALARMHVGVWRAAYGHLLPAAALDGVDLADSAQRWRRSARGEVEPPRSVLVADDDGTIVGFVAFGAPREDVPPGTGEVLALYVVEPRWGSDLGHRLLAAARRSLRESGYDRLYLWVLEDNPRARGFYERAGLTYDGTRKMIDFLGCDLPELRYAGPAAFVSDQERAHSTT
ncbi:MAG TPA: GNAT family N-acetyltransferase [Mycobacteriales bacterium]|nr:GNAT family N-acetyltransferase [Mycobacteriales bacterium]